MPTTPETDQDTGDWRDQALLYAMGALPWEQRDAFELRLAGGDELAMDEVERMQLAIERLMSLAPLPAPRRRVKDMLMTAATKARVPGFEHPEPGVEVLRSGRGRWIDTGYKGVSTKILHIEKETRMATTILKLAPGAMYPPHHHSMLEQCVVLNGDVRLGSKLHIFEGDYEKALAGTEHEYVTSDTGCELLIISCLEDEIMTH